MRLLSRLLPLFGILVFSITFSVTGFSRAEVGSNKGGYGGGDIVKKVTLMDNTDDDPIIDCSMPGKDCKIRLPK